MKLLGSISTALKALNWQAALLKVGIVAAFSAVLVMYGVSLGNSKCAEQQIEAADKRAEAVKEFAPTVAEQETKAVKQEHRVERALEEYSNESNKTVRPASCDLSADELRSFQKLVEG